MPRGVIESALKLAGIVSELLGLFGLSWWWWALTDCVLTACPSRAGVEGGGRQQQQARDPQTQFPRGDNTLLLVAR